MATQPGTGAPRPRIRDTLYVDIGGSVLSWPSCEEVSSKPWWSDQATETSDDSELESWGVEGARNLLEESTVEHTTTLQDVLLDLFEEAADEVSLFVEAPFYDV